MIKRISILLTAIIFMVTFNISLAKMLEKKRPRLPSKEQRGERIQNRVKELSIKLNLNDEQGKKITGILTKSKEKINQLLEETGDKIAQMREKSEQDLQAVLTKEQRDKYIAAPQESEEEELIKVFKTTY